MQIQCNCPFARTGPLRTKSRCEVPMRFTPGTQVMLVYASGQRMEQRSCGCSQLWHSAPPGMAVGCCELRLRSTPRYRLVCICFPTPGRGLPYGSGLGLSRCLGPGECLHSFIHADTVFMCTKGVLSSTLVSCHLSLITITSACQAGGQ